MVDKQLNLKPFFFIGLLVVVVAGGWFILSGSDSSGPSDGDGTTVRSGTVTVTITNAGFEPREITVEKGTTVVWETTRSQPGWPASNVHPAHTQYPAGDYDQPGQYVASQACTGEGEQKGEAFDACQELTQGETWSFTFDRTGTWRYHDHLNPGKTGAIRVVEGGG